jgi:hypothetical protein
MAFMRQTGLVEDFYALLAFTTNGAWGGRIHDIRFRLNPKPRARP